MIPPRSESPQFPIPWSTTTSSSIDDNGRDRYDIIDDAIKYIDGSVAVSIDSATQDNYHLDSPELKRTFTVASNSTACTDAEMQDDSAADVFGIIPIHKQPSRQRSRELQESNPFLAPRKTEQILISSKHEPYNIPAFNTLDFPHWVCPPEHVKADPEGRGGWLSALHPDGSLYFHKTCQGDCGPFNMLTEAYLHGEDMLYEVTAFARYMWRHMMLLQDKFVDGDFELTINVKIDGETDKVVWSYYFVDHIHHMPFWMRDYNPSIHMRTTERLGASSPDHLRHLLTAMYWEHCALYPRHTGGPRVLSDDIHAHMVTELAWCAAESVIAPIRYTAPYTAEEAIRLREQLDYLRMNSERNPESYIEVAGRTMSTIERWRYNFLHGTQVIRRFRGQTVLPLRNHSLLYRVLTPLLFYAPLPHFYDCKSVYLDGILANEPEWANYVAKLLAEWQEFVLYATILLNANLAFLTVPNAILSANGAAISAPDSASTSPERQPVSPASILSYCSMLASFGSVVMGLLLIRQHRGEELVDNPRTNKATFMEKRQSPRFGFELLSILYSLPYVLLMWSVLFFLSAFIAFTQLNSDWPTRAAILAGLAVIMILSLWCIQMGWGSSLSRDFFRFRKCVKLSAAPSNRAAAQVMVGLAAVQNMSSRFVSEKRRGVLSVVRFRRAGERTKGGEQPV